MEEPPHKQAKIIEPLPAARASEERTGGCAVSPLRVGIVGGGLGGLGVALCLQRLGADCVVYERDAFFSDRKQGYGLTLTNNKKGGLAKLGLLEECIRRDCASRCHWIFSPEGSVLGYFGRAFSTSSTNSKIDDANESEMRGNLRVPRQDLRQLLIDKLAPGTIEWGRRLSDYREDDAGVLLDWCDGSTTGPFDVVVGADGIRSRVRELRDLRLNVKGSKLLYVGVSVILGISTAQHPLIRKQGFYVLDGQHRLFTMPFRDGGGDGAPSPSTSAGEEEEKKNTTPSPSSSSPPYETMWQLSFSGLSEEEAAQLRSLSPRQLLDAALKRTAGWFAPVDALVKNTAEEAVWATGLFDRDPLVVAKQPHLSSRVTVLGDAAHPMSMFKGQGCNQALEDGPLLAYWLCGGPSAAQAKGAKGRDKHFAALAGPVQLSAPPRSTLLTRLRCFEREMVARAGPKVMASRAAAHSLHDPAVLEQWHGLAGCSESEGPAVLTRLREEGVSAHDAQALAARVGAVLAAPAPAPASAPAPAAQI